MQQVINAGQGPVHASGDVGANCGVVRVRGDVQHSRLDAVRAGRGLTGKPTAALGSHPIVGRSPDPFLVLLPILAAPRAAPPVAQITTRARK